MSATKTLHPWILAARPKTLLATLSPIFVVGCLAYSSQGSIDWFLLLCGFCSAMMFQIGVNYVNDALDCKKGADTQERLGPLRVCSAGLLPVQYVHRAGLAIILLGLIFGIPLVFKGGWPAVSILVSAAIATYCYTGGPYPLSYLGLGELFVLLFFGYAYVVGGYYILTGTVNASAWLAGTQVGFLCAALNAIVNLRDIEEDRKTKKATLATRYGETFGRMQITFLLLSPYLLSIFWLPLGYLMAAILPWIALPLGMRLIRNIWETDPSAKYNSFIPICGLHFLLFSVASAIGFLSPGSVIPSGLP